MNILVTGGAGYIGSHICIELLQAGHHVTAVDNLCNASRKAISEVEIIAQTPLVFYAIDLRDEKGLNEVFLTSDIDAVIHCGALKAVGESVRRSMDYYDNNLGGLLSLCKVMDARKVKKLVFSSSATVYGAAKKVPITEDAPLAATNPYGWSKLMSEQILRDLSVSDPDWHIMLLRYFNPVGAHPSGRIGEDPKGIPNNLAPYIVQVAAGKLDKLRVFGGDYDTPDGTGVRDYIHVVDLARGHICALNHMRAGAFAYNLGMGRGYSVLEVIRTFEKVSGLNIAYEITARRPGDVAAYYADPSLARRQLGWRTTLTLEDMCRDAWNWQQKNPDGYDDNQK